MKRASFLLTTVFLLVGCQTTHRIGFVPVESRVLSGPDLPAEEDRGDPSSRIRISWRVSGWYREEGEEDRGPEIDVALYCSNVSQEAFVIEPATLRILDDEGRAFHPDLTAEERSSTLVCDPESAATFVIPFRPEAWLDLANVASIRIIWSYRVGPYEREMQTKFFRTSIASPDRHWWSFGLYFPFVVIPP